VKPKSFDVAVICGPVLAGLQMLLLINFMTSCIHNIRKLICNFLLVINSNLPPILHRFRDTVLEMSKITIFWLSLLRVTPDGGVPLERSP